MNVLIVESPSKAKSINKYLGSGFKVLASVGHVRDLSAKNDAIDTENDFQMKWETSDRGKKVIKEITCLLYTSPSPRDRQKSRMPSSA